MNSKKAITLLVLATLVMAMVPIMPAQAITIATITPGTDVKDETVVVEGAGVTAGATVEVYWDAVAAWDGTDGLLNSTTAKASGAYEIWFDVPESTFGNHYVWVRDVSTGETVVGAAFVVTELVEASSTSGLEDDKVDVDAYGFPSEVDVAFLLTDVAQTATAAAALPEALGTLGTATVYEYTLDETLIEPGSVRLLDTAVSPSTWTDQGDGTITSAPDVGDATIDYLTGELVITYDAAPGAITIAATAYDTYTATKDVTYIFSSGVETSELGTASKSCTIPDETTEMAYGSYEFYVYDGAGNSNTVAFDIGAVISLDVDEGPVGTVVEITGTGFDDAQTIVEAEVTIAKDAAGTDALPLPIKDFDTSEAISNSGFTFEVVIPSVDMDLYDTIIVNEAGAGDKATASFDILGEASIEVTPGHGTQGSTVLVEGWNFTGGEDVVLTLGGLGAETYEVDSDGTFEVSYTIPAVATGTATLLADQADYDIDTTTTFRAGIMIVILNPTSGPAGTKVSVTGTGFTNAGDWNATFGDEEWQDDKAATATEIAADLYVPTTDPGVYTVSVYDIDAEITVEVEFEVTESTYIETDPSEAPAGFTVEVEGYNFAEDVALNNLEILMYNDTHEWEAGDLAWATPVDPDAGTDDAWDDGYWSEEIVLPGEDDISVGTYYVNITSDEGMYAQLMFDVVSKTVDINPRKAEFSVGDTLAFDVESSFAMDDSYIEIYEPNGDLYWSTDVFDDDTGMWLSVGTIERVLYADQVSGGNPLVFLDDAPLGEWSWEMYDDADDLVDEGVFTLVAAAADVIGGQVADLANDISDLASQLTDVTSDFADVQSSIADVSALAADAVAAANAATEAVNAVASTANTASEAAANAATAAEAARDAASGLTTLVYGAIGAALVAALAAIVSLMQISRRIAG